MVERERCRIAPARPGRKRRNLPRQGEMERRSQGRSSRCLQDYQAQRLHQLGHRIGLCQSYVSHTQEQQADPFSVDPCLREFQQFLLLLLIVSNVHLIFSSGISRYKGRSISILAVLAHRSRNRVRR